MNCPKCSAVQADGREECSSCGVVFARFAEARERALLRRTTASQQEAVPPPPAELTVPRWAVGVVLLLVVFAGVVWTARRRVERARANPTAEANAMLDEINRKGVKPRERLAQETARVRATAWETPAGVRGYTHAPPGLTDEKGKGLLELCSGFTRFETVELPKVVSEYMRGYTLERYPSLANAENYGVVALEKDGPNYNVTLLPSVAGRLRISETSANYVVALGRRRVGKVTQITGSPTAATGRFDYEYEERYAADLLIRPHSLFYGSVTFTNINGAWKATRAVPDTKGRATSTDLCK